MIWDILAIIGIVAIMAVCGAIVWAVYELRRLAVKMDWTIEQ